jgi:histidine triad (HIT) family protein
MSVLGCLIVPCAKARSFRSSGLPCRGIAVAEWVNTMTVFQKIIARQIPAKIIWEDDDAIAFDDVNPQAPVHVLIVPKRVVPRLADATESDRALLGKLLLVASDLAKKLDLSSGYRVVINSGSDAGESVPHLHVHLLGKRALAWPPG